MLYISPKNIFFFSFLLAPFSLYAQPDKLIPNALPTFHLAPTYNYTPAITSEIYPHITAELHPNIIVSNTSALSVKISDISAQCVQKIKDTMTPENYNLLKKKLWQYKYTIAGSTLVGSYSMVSALLLADYYYVQDKNLWARWKRECSFECLCTMPQKTLTQELLITINERNYNKNNPTDFAHPLTMFITAIDTEIKVCKRYIATAQSIKRMGLMRIFPINDTKIDEVTKLLERALFIKHLFLSWLSDYNIANN